MPHKESYKCPVSPCSCEYQVKQTLFQHVNLHLSSNISIPASFLNEYDRFVCNHCNKNYSIKRRHVCSESIQSSSVSISTSDESNTRDASCPTSSHSDPSGSSEDGKKRLLADFESFRRGSVIYRIPKASRTQVAFALCTLVNVVCETNTIDSWRNLLRFPSHCLRKPNDQKHRQGPLSKIINRRVAEYLSDPSALLEIPKNSTSKRKDNASKTDRTKLAQRKIEKGDIKGAVRIISSDEQLCADSEETLRKLIEKHPAAHPNRSFPEEPSSQMADGALNCTDAQVRRAILSFAAGSASGPDLLEPQHLKDLIAKSGGEAANKLIVALTRLCNFMLAGKVPEEVVPFVYGASLFALSKANADVRPIAIGCVYRRLVGKLAARFGFSLLKDLFYPHQMGVGAPKGAETIVHTVRNRLLSNFESNTPFFMLKIDFKNAFNTIRRDVVLGEMKNQAPCLFPFTWQLYSSNTNLFYGDHVIASAEGMQQGDPLGPLGFSLAINGLITKLKSDLNCWYLDDGCLLGSFQDVQDDFNAILRNQDSFGLAINSSKCEIFDPFSLRSDDSNVFENARVLSTANASLLGSPLFFDSAKCLFLEKLQQMKTFVQRLIDLDSHYAFYLLKNCFSLPKFLYILRCFPFYDCSQLLLQFDDLQRQALEHIINCSLSPVSHQQCFLPSCLGGLGIRRATDIALPAFLASRHSVAKAMSDLLQQGMVTNDLEEALLRWENKCPDAVQPTDASRFTQKAWDKPIFQRQYDELLSCVTSDSAKARLLASASPGASAWLTPPPLPTLGLKLSNEQLRIAIALRLGAPICAPNRCKCGTTVDSLGTHGLSCKFNAGRLARHTEANDIIRRALVSAGLPAVLEPHGLCRDDGKRPDGMTLTPWSNGRPLVWDFTCTDTLATSNLPFSRQEGGKLASFAEQRKKKKYTTLSREFTFVPVAVETLGAWGQEGDLLIRAIGKRISEATGETRATNFLRQRLSLAVQRGNAASILSCLPKSSDFNEIYFFT